MTRSKLSPQYLTGLDRRSFLSLSAASAALLPMVAATTTPTTALAAKAKGWRDLNKTIVINGLGGIGNPNIKLEAMKAGTASNKGKAIAEDRANSVDARAIKEARESGMTAVNVTLGHVAGDKEPFEQSVKDIAEWDALIRNNPKDLVKILTAADIRKAKKDGKVGIIYGFQNTLMMGDDASRADIFANLGVRIIQLTYNPRNKVGDGSMAPENQGLTDLGRELIARLQTNKVLVDLSHSGQQTCLDAIKAATAPITISHTGCRALADLPRNKTDEEMRLVAQGGGVVGIYFMPFLKVESRPTAEDVVAHIEHAINVCGEDHVGIGTDGGTTQIDDMETYQTALRNEVEARAKSGIGAKGERADTYPFILDLRGPGQFQKLGDMLAARGHKSARIEKILGANFLRLFEDVWTA